MLNFTDRKTKIFKCDIFIFMTSAFSEVDCLQNWGRICYIECTRYNNSTTDDNTDIIFTSAGQVYPHILKTNQSINKKLQCWFYYVCECQSHPICASLYISLSPQNLWSRRFDYWINTLSYILFIYFLSAKCKSFVYVEETHPRLSDSDSGFSFKDVLSCTDCSI